MMGKVDVERAERVGCPASGRRLEAEACWVDRGNDSHLGSAIGQVYAAGAAVVLDKDA